MHALSFLRQKVPFLGGVQARLSIVIFCFFLVSGFWKCQHHNMRLVYAQFIHPMLRNFSCRLNAIYSYLFLKALKFSLCLVII